MFACNLTQILLEYTHVRDVCEAIIDLLFIGNYFHDYRVSVEGGACLTVGLFISLLMLVLAVTVKRYLLEVLKIFSLADDEAVLQFWACVEAISAVPMFFLYGKGSCAYVITA